MEIINKFLSKYSKHSNKHNNKYNKFNYNQKILYRKIFKKNTISI